MLSTSAARQRGAIGLMAVITLGLALLMLLLVVDSGRLYLEQRKLQRIADMAARAHGRQPQRPCARWPVTGHLRLRPER